MSGDLNPVVVEREPCPQTDQPGERFCTEMARRGRDESCLGCFGDGTRAVLDTAREVVELRPDLLLPRREWREVQP